jgi:uncharacterized protein with GYD domain
MPTYVSLLNWTEQGFANVKQSPQQLDAARRQLQDRGGQLKEVYFLLGGYDMAFVSEAPDDDSYAAFLLSLCSKAGVRTTTMKAFTEEQFRTILGAL